MPARWGHLAKGASGGLDGLAEQQWGVSQGARMHSGSPGGCMRCTPACTWRLGVHAPACLSCRAARRSPRPATRHAEGALVAGGLQLPPHLSCLHPLRPTAGPLEAHARRVLAGGRGAALQHCGHADQHRWAPGRAVVVMLTYADYCRGQPIHGEGANLWRLPQTGVAAAPARLQAPAGTLPAPWASPLNMLVPCPLPSNRCSRARRAQVCRLLC